MKLPVTVEFSGGADLLFDKVKKHDIELPASERKCDNGDKILILFEKTKLTHLRLIIILQGLIPLTEHVKVFGAKQLVVQTCMDDAARDAHYPDLLQMLDLIYIFWMSNQVKDFRAGKIRNLLTYIRDNLLKERPELFMQGDTVRPGILVLVNDADWELLGELDYELQPNDRIVFISTLHGG